MCEFCRKNPGKSARVREVARLAHNILKVVKPRKLILFGSFARGDFSDASDADFIIVADFKEPFFRRAAKILELADGTLGVDVLAYTPGEFKRLATLRSPVIRRALREGLQLV